MDKLRAALRRDFRDYEPIASFEAAIPLYFARLVVEVLEPQVLTSFEIYMLHAIALGVNTHERIAALLGVQDRDLLGAGAKLLKRGYIEQQLSIGGGVRLLSLSEQGRQALSEQGPPPIPQRKSCYLHFDTLTWTPIAREDTWSVKQMRDAGLSILPSKRAEALTLGDFTEGDVTTALSGVSAFEGNRIIALLELRKAEKQYLAPVTVVLLRQPLNGEQQLAIYRHGMQLRTDSIALHRLFENGLFTLPPERASLKEQQLPLPTSLHQTAQQATQHLLQAERAISHLETELVVQEESQQETPQEQERQNTRIEQLKEELRIRREECEELRQQLREHQVEFLKTEQHRNVLERAFREAKEEVLIISPWLNRRACTDDLCRLMAQAVARGVRIRIAYGIGRERHPQEAARNRNNLYEVKKALQQVVPPASTHLLEMVETDGTHQKILVCDRSFAVNGSFNWLSYLGQKDAGYRDETGTLFRGKHQVEELAAIALRAFANAKKGP